MVRLFEQARGSRVVILADLWQPREPRPEDLEQVERAVSFTATLAAAVCRAGENRLSLGIAGEDPSWTAGLASPLVAEQTFERLAVARATSRDVLAELLERAVVREDAGDAWILVSTRPGDAACRRRLASLRNEPAWQRLAEQVQVFSLTDPEVSNYFHPG